MSLKSTLLERKLTVGSWLTIPHTIVADILCRQKKLDWICVDMEHTAIEFSDLLPIIQVCDGHKKDSLVRVGKNDPEYIKKALDLGATGVVVPMVNTKDDALAAVDSAKYPPLGKRGVGLFRAQDYGDGFDEYVKRNQDETVVIVQIEHIEAVQNIEAILSIDGIDGLMMGPYDLSASMGFPGKFDRPEFQSAFEKVMSAAGRAQKSAGLHIVHPDQKLYHERVQQGFNLIAYGVDFIMLNESYKVHLPTS